MSGPRPLEPGLYLVATPIGSARDITLRALDILGAADVLAAEDTRTLRHLMEIHGIPLSGRRIVAHHDHNAATAIPQLLEALAGGRTVACVSEAGTPLVADPGYELARAAVAAGYRVYAAPGASAVLAALTVSGLPSDRFLFAGFPPARSGQRKRWLKDLAGISATVILFESPRRVRETLGDLCETFGGERRAALCRELTKKFEETRRDTLMGLWQGMAGQEGRGEFVIVVDRPGAVGADPQEVGAALAAALRVMSRKDAAAEVAERFGLPKREVYQMALAAKVER
jgi:16S rRNA (cytidine1402-2'-O)-methyltransferase